MSFKWFTPSALAVLIPVTAHALGISVLIEGKAVILKDVPQSAWFAAYVRKAAEAGIVTGYKDKAGNPTGRFEPSSNITVAETLKIASEGAGYDEGVYAAKISSGTNHWASPYVSVARGENFPVVLPRLPLEQRATRGEVAAMLVAAFRARTDTSMSNSFADVNAATEFGTAIEALSRDKVVSGDTDANGNVVGTFRPGEYINRAEVAKMIMSARAAYGEPGKGRAPGEETGDETMEGNVVVYGATGFTPQVLRVKRGEAVTFKNLSGGGMWVASDPHPSHTALPGLDSLQVIVAGQMYSYTFTQLGSWSYHNHLNTGHRGTIVVEE